MTIHKQFIRFLLVGGIATALHYAILILLVQTGLARAVVASSIGFAASAVLNYSLNRHVTFRSSRPHAQAAPRFVLVACTGLGINAALLWLLHGPGSQHYLIAQVLATLGTIVWNFALNRLWTFAKLMEHPIPEQEPKP